MNIKRMFSILFASIVALSLLVCPAKAQTVGEPQAAADAKETVDKAAVGTKAAAEPQATVNAQAAANAQVAENNAKKFAGFNWGVGIGFGAFQKKNISDASVVDGKVRVNKEERYMTSLMLESHYYFTSTDFQGKVTQLTNAIKSQTFSTIVLASQALSESHTCGIGPFMAIQLTDLSQDNGNALDVLGAGFMVGCTRIKGEAQNSAWNIGIGAFVDKNLKVLGDGIQDGQPLPGNETQIRFKTIDSIGLLVLFSASF